MKLKDIKIRTCKNEWITIRGYDLGNGMSIHRKLLNTIGHLSKTDWAITHIQSGRAIQNCRNTKLKDVIKIADKLKHLDWQQPEEVAITYGQEVRQALK